MSGRELVVGVDVGSQGTCAQALDRRRRAAAHGLRPARAVLSAAGLGRAGPRASGWARSAAGVGRGAAGGRRRRDRASRSARSWTVWWRPTQPASRCGPALIWMDRRAGAQCDAAAERIDPGRLRELTGCNLDPGHVAAKIAWLARAPGQTQHRAARWFLLPGSFVAWRASGELAVDPSNASSSMLLDVRRRRLVGRGLRRLRDRPGIAGPGRSRRTRRWGRSRPGCARRRVWTRRHARWCWGAATRWPPRWAPASSSRASCAT